MQTVQHEILDSSVKRVIVVTGGCGFIGSNLILYLLKHRPNWEIINIDALTYAANPVYLAGIASDPRYHFAHVDIRNRTELQKVFDQYQPNGVFHLAAESHVDNSINNPQCFIESNVIGTFQLLDCPLLIAAPLSFIGGLNKAARKNIIVKSPFVLELLAKTKTLFFDKTGTLTLGIPRLGKIEAFDPSVGETEALSLAAALERHSFHPIAKSFVAEQGKRGGAVSEAENVEEKIGEGMFGEIGGRRYGVVKAAGISDNGIVVELVREGVPIARFFFDDELKEDVGRVFGYLRERGYRLGILTGDKKANAERLFGHFRLPIYASCSPEKKMTLVTRAQQKGELVGMIGDGMNDAPALALADVGIVFSGTENSASTEAADVAILERDAWLIRDAVHIGRRSYHVALQSILIGIGLSTAGMLFAFFGFISPITGAVLQEVIDAVVIVNALRSTY